MENMTRKMSWAEVHVVPAELFTLCPTVHPYYLFMILSDYHKSHTSCTDSMYTYNKALAAAYHLLNAVCAKIWIHFNVCEFMCTCVKV